MFLSLYVYIYIYIYIHTYVLYPPEAQAPAEPSGGAAAVRLRGLPFTATEQDVYKYMFMLYDIML